MKTDLGGVIWGRIKLCLKQALFHDTLSLFLNQFDLGFLKILPQWVLANFLSVVGLWIVLVWLCDSRNKILEEKRLEFFFHTHFLNWSAWKMMRRGFGLLNRTQSYLDLHSFKSGRTIFHSIWNFCMNWQVGRVCTDELKRSNLQGIAKLWVWVLTHGMA